MQHLFPCIVLREKGSPIPGAQQEGPETSSHRAAVTWTTTAQKLKRGLGKLFENKLQHQPATDIPCPPEPLLSPEKYGRMKGKAEAWAQARPTRRHTSSLCCGPCSRYSTRVQITPQACSFTAQGPPLGPTGQRHPIQAPPAGLTLDRGRLPKAGCAERRLDKSYAKLIPGKHFPTPKFHCDNNMKSLLIHVSLTTVMHFPCSVLGSWVWGNSGLDLRSSFSSY